VSPPPPRPPDDEELGDAIARTDLAWSRSGLALAVAAAAILKVVVHLTDARTEVLVLVGIGAVAIAWLLAIGHARVIARPAIEGRQQNEARMRLAALSAIAFAVAAIVIIQLPRS
jgi:uncharacterized membrane protein YidH (DUF202 family)